MSKRQLLIIVDENDVETGEYLDKGECHFGTGVHHRAFSVVIENAEGKILLQLRKHVRWDKYWDLTAISHVLHIEDRNESYEEAGLRALNDEVGIGGVDLKNIGGFNYFEKYHGHCENEYCAILVGRYSGVIKPNPDLIYETKWVTKEFFLKDAIENSDKYTPWAIESVEVLRRYYE